MVDFEIIPIEVVRGQIFGGMGARFSLVKVGRLGSQTPPKQRDPLSAPFLEKLTCVNLPCFKLPPSLDHTIEVEGTSLAV